MSPAGAGSSSGGQGVRWEVLGQTETVDRNAQGKLVPGYRVDFSTPSNIVGSIFVPKVDYSAAKVRQLLVAHIAELEAVSGSTGG